MRWSCSTCLCPCHRQLAQVDIGVPEMIYGAFNTNNDGVLVALDSLAMGWQVFFFGAIIAAVIIIFILIIAVVDSFILMTKNVKILSGRLLDQGSHSQRSLQLLRRLQGTSIADQMIMITIMMISSLMTALSRS